MTLFGIDISVRLEHAANALIPIAVTLLEIVTEVRFEQYKKVPSSMLVRLSGIVIKDIVFNTCNAVRNSDRSYSRATIECFHSSASDTVGD